MPKDKYCRSIVLSLTLAAALIAGPKKIQKNIVIDQFGYRPEDYKVAVIADPVIGIASVGRFTPGHVYEVRFWKNDKTVYSDTIRRWNEGAVDFTSGDRGWWFDFTKVTNEGEYYIYDREKGVGSYRFRILKDVYKDILKAAVRTFYYQRINDPKKKPYAEEPWIDDAAFVGPNQDGHALFVDEKANGSPAKNMSGGWMDAGDYNKYVTFAAKAVHVMLTTFEQNPQIFADDYNIPESGNGVPDILDEVKYEIDWLKKMQDEDGGVYIKVGNIDFNTVCPPSRDARPRFYGPKCSSSSITASGMFAHAALTLSAFPQLTGYSQELKRRAVKAWNWYENNPRSEECDSQEIKSGDADLSLDMQDQAQVVAAVYLFALTGEAKYDSVVKNNFYVTASFYDPHLAMYFSQQEDALFYYTVLPGGDEHVKHAIFSHRERQGKGMDIFRFREADDLYMAYLPAALYNWGSNHPRAGLGAASYDFILHDLNPENKEMYRRRASGILHYFHGVNPFGIVYLSNMYRFGADYCADNIWHDWFRQGTKWAVPPPGFMTGGPNCNYSGSLKELYLQPIQKCYRNWNNGYPENSWEMTEPAIYYEAAYIKLLSKFISPE
jgi:endoglucanase